ncbi:hypothetical protein AU195_08550 [Mycobacterium sp. IS-1496]|nr:hypothetical protein AU195_08550 [Mycobacterium sp. IS-1496]
MAAVQAAAPATCTATSAAGTPVTNCTAPTVPWATTIAARTPSRISTGRCARTASSPKPRAITRDKYATSSDECRCTSVVISTCRRGTGCSMLLSPACGPAPVTRVPVTRVAARVRALSSVNWRRGLGTVRTGAPPSGSPILTNSRTDSHTMAMETSRWIATVHHSNPVSTVMPPITACATVDAGISHA